MKAQRIAILAIFAVIFFRTGTQAALLEDFQFNDADGTALNMAANSASAHMWVHDTDHAATIQVQSGSLNIVKNNTDFVTEGLGFDDVSSGVLWMVAEFANWAVLGSAPDGNNVEEIRFGFMGTEDLTPPPSSTVLAEMMISRNHGAGQFQISGTALGAAGTNIATANINFVQNDPFVMAMRVDQDTDTYAIYYKDGSNPAALLGEGNLEPTRDAIVVRMTINNFWGDEVGEFANLDRFYISTRIPPGIPEPSTCLLALFAGIGWFARRRRG
ncbi:MAG: PEP-CTERM sorting domain-containing protein [Pirellulales bacterium]